MTRHEGSVLSRWLENIRDWCISRQLWWGHRIPAWYAQRPGLSAPGGPSEDTARWVVAPDEATAQALAADRFPGEDFELVQVHA